MVADLHTIGVDESGKGDFFGPLVVAAFLCPDSEINCLRAKAVRDGKNIANNPLLELDDWLRSKYPYALVVYSPKDYNEQYAKIKNLNKLLAAGHAEAIDRVLKNMTADLAISDKFGKSVLIEQELRKRKQTVRLEQLVRGEQIAQVAAASILARAEFLRQMKKLSTEFALELPRGAAAHVDKAGRQFVRLHGAERLSEVAKLHFKNYHRVVNPRLSV
ncbi:MAG: ribonuclease HIII [Candidatus Zixiibacteriota bacterium]